MKSFIQLVMTFNKSKVDPYKGLRQGLLMIIPALLGYYFGFFSFGILIATGTLAHIYVFKGAPKSQIRIVILCSLAFVVCMMLGTLTTAQPIIFGILLLIVTVVPFYIFTSLKIAGPSSTFFIVTFCLPMNLPIAPDQALIRGLAILIGGILATLMVLLTIYIKKEKAEDSAINADFKVIQDMMENYNDPEAFKKVANSAVSAFKASDKLLITSSANNDKMSSRFQKLLLIHTSVQGIYSELLELNEKNIRPLPNDLIEMLNFIINKVKHPKTNHQTWKKEINVSSEFENLLNHILKIDEIAHADSNHIEHEAKIRTPLYSKRILQNLTLDSIVFRNTLRYTVIMSAAIFIALFFGFDKAYWIPLSAHTLLVGTSTIHSLERGTARSFGTILGVIVLTGILAFSIPTPLAIILMGLGAGITEMFVGANYTFAVIFITIQVILLNGLASQNLSISIAYPRIVDVIIGVAISTIGLFILGQRTSSILLPNTIAEVVRKEASFFHYLFSENKYHNKEEEKNLNLGLSVRLNNMTQMYNAANGELFSNKKVIQYYYPSIFALEEISFMLSRALSDNHRSRIDDQLMGEYLTTFENIAKHFELQSHLEVKELTDLPQYNYIKSGLMKIQKNSQKAREDAIEAGILGK
ncbi:FUSC family protein [Staphylococcus pasteuri]|nr:FUSC family protein [Staphylococcus pasteuri]QQT12229.1 FUSC family protein [Staphylococcus pasteuri]RTX71322.1 FUSC family protein [Staphylococcus pasteuri]